jgi:hypothetical protein
MYRLLFLVAAALLVDIAPCRADLIVSLGNLDIGLGGVGSLDVMLSSSNSSPVNFDSFGFEFQVSLVSGQGRLQFTPTQVDPFTSTNYVFYGDSGDQGSTSLGTVSGTSPPANSYIGGDFTNDGNEVAVTNSVLLAHLSFTAATSLPPTLGSTFQVSLIANPADSYFDDGSTPNRYEVVGGSILVVRPTLAVPEPSSILLVVVGGLTGLVALGWKRREAFWLRSRQSLRGLG